MLDKCPQCPVAVGRCLAQRTGHVRFCELVLDRPDYADFLRDEAKNPREVATTPVTVVMDTLKRIKECPHFEKRSDCGCGINWCKRDITTVSLNDCKNCVLESERHLDEIKPVGST